MIKTILILGICSILGACAGTPQAGSNPEPLLAFNTLADQIVISRERINDDAEEASAGKPVRTAMTASRRGK